MFLSVVVYSMHTLFKQGLKQWRSRAQGRYVKIMKILRQGIRTGNERIKTESTDKNYNPLY